MEVDVWEIHQLKLWGFLVYVFLFFVLPPVALKILYLFLIFDNLTVVCLSVALFGFKLFEVF